MKTLLLMLSEGRNMPYEFVCIRIPNVPAKFIIYVYAPILSCCVQMEHRYFIPVTPVFFFFFVNTTFRKVEL